MDDVIVIKETPNYHNYLTLCPSTKGKTTYCYKLHTNRIDGLRRGKNPHGLRYVMPLGGPLLTEGEILPTTDRKIIQIIFIDQENTFIILENDN